MAHKALPPEQHARQHGLIREMTELLHDLTHGRVARTDVAAWVEKVWPRGEGGEAPFVGHGTAFTVLLSISGIEEKTVREHDLRAYVRWLTEGEAFLGDSNPFLTLPGTIADLRLPGWIDPPVRFWVQGLGWHESIQLGSAATGRPFFIHADIGFSPGPPQVQITKRAEDDLQAAALDVFETLAVDDRDALYLDPRVELAQFTQWEVWRLDDNNNEALIDTFRCRAKAVLTQQRFEARGHRQTYWVVERKPP